MLIIIEGGNIEAIIFRREGSIEIITLKRSEKLNAFSFNMIETLTRGFERLNLEDEVRAAKEKVFQDVGLDPKDPRFATGEKMRESIQELIGAIKKFFSTKTREECLEILEEADVVCAPVYNLAEVADDPQVLANEYLVEIEHPKEGKLRILNNPVTLSN